MPRVLLIVAVLALAFYVVSIVDVAVQPASRHRGVSKTTWIAIVILLPVLGGALWFVVGRSRPSRAKLSLAPDDDPEFLGRVGGSFSDQDERIRRLEEELALLDSESDDPIPDAKGTGPNSAGPKTADPNTADPDAEGPRRGSIG